MEDILSEEDKWFLEAWIRKIYIPNALNTLKNLITDKKDEVQTVPDKVERTSR